MKYKTIHSLWPLLLLCIAASVQAQYVTLKNKQFYDQAGQPFYPVICNYIVNITCNNCQNIDNSNGWCNNCNATDFALQPENRYGNSTGYEANFTGGLARIRADFQQMIAMGFNTVRIMGLMAFIHDKHSPDPNARIGNRFICYDYNNPYTGQFWWGHPLKSDDSDYLNDWVLNNVVFPSIQNLFDVAEQVGIKVIFVTGGGSVSASVSKEIDNTVKPPLITLFPNADELQAQVYTLYLKRLAGQLKNRTGLLAYDLYNEPGFGMYSDYGPVCADQKSKICTFTSQWYDAIKAIDSVHLITMGNTDLRDIMFYDPAIIKLDFNSYHIYPVWYAMEYENFNRQLAINRLETQFHWFNRNSPIPYIMGETGVAAWSMANQGVIIGQNTDNTLFNFTTQLVGQNLTAMPIMWGTLEDQADYAVQSRAIVLNQGGSGYSWWALQDCARRGTTSLFDGGSPLDFNQAQYNFTNLMHRGSVVATNPSFANQQWTYNNSLNKPLIAEAFGNGQPTHPTAPANMPAGYYNAFGGNINSNYTCSGIVTETSGAPIQDAVVYATNNWSLPFGNGQGQDPRPLNLRFNIFTFTDQDGHFDAIAPFDNVFSTPTPNQPTIIDFSKFVKVELSAPAANVVRLYDWQLNQIGANANHVNIPQNQLALSRTAGVFDKKITNTTISSGPVVQSARHSILLQNVTVNQNVSAEFVAPMAISIEAGFEATAGTETYIHCDQVHFDCMQSPPFSYKTGPDEDVQSLKDQVNVNVEYTLPEGSVKLWPNPAQEVVYLQSSIAGNAEIVVVDVFGHEILSFTLELRDQQSFNVSRLGAGSYFVTVRQQDTRQTFPLIILKN